MTTEHHLNCKQCIDFLADYLEGVLPAEQSAEFERHLSKCPPCVTYVENYRKLTQLARAAGREARACPEGRIPEGLVQAILQAMREQPPKA